MTGWQRYEATYTVALNTLDGELVVVAADADWLAVVRYERAVADRREALTAAETVLMPLLRLVQILLGTFIIYATHTNQCTSKRAASAGALQDKKVYSISLKVCKRNFFWERAVPDS